VPDSKDIELFETVLGQVEELESRGYSRKEILDHLKKPVASVHIPVSIFQGNFLSPLETIVKYLQESHGFTYRDIGRLTNRDENCIGITYRSARSKLKGRLDTSSQKTFPLSILRNRKLSVLENLVFYLKSGGLRYSEIAKLLNRDERTVWTVYSRALKKGGGRK
jgi:DNA-binding CsgD family transcriptional regulator